MASEKHKFFEEKLKYSTEYAINIDERIIYLFAEFEANLGTILRVRYDLIKLWWDEVKDKKFDDITIDISSYGGTIDSINGAFDFFHELSSKGIKVNTRAQGVCMSAATVLLAGGTGVRSSFPFCSFMLHDLQCEGIEGTANQVKHSVKTISDEQLTFFSYYAKFARRGKDPLTEKELLQEAKKWHKKYTKDGVDHYITPIKMKELNLIDHIL
jgi:ATP-dependent protease ClpP protease subunit